jgi:hypothetical protein
MDVYLYKGGGMHLTQFVRHFLFRPMALVVLLCFGSSAVMPSGAYAQALNLPAPGTMVLATPAFVPVLMRGVKIHPDNPLLMDFIVDSGKSGLSVTAPAFKAESQTLIKYFLAALTIKEEDLWVNLSPYEKDRMMPGALGQTELGRDMLAQDYVLKQLTASLMYPEKELGKAFWDKIYTKAQQEFGTTDIPVDTFNKVWIVADKARVLERNNTAYVTGAHLKVMLAEDYTALNAQAAGTTVAAPAGDAKAHAVAAQVIRDVIIPAIEKEVNEGGHFAVLRQMFYTMILASWYKLTLKNALLNQVYSNKEKTGGVLSDDPAVKEKIYAQYLQAFKTGVFNYIKEDVDAVSQQAVPRKYFSGGEKINAAKILEVRHESSVDDDAMTVGDSAQIVTRVARIDAAMKGTKIAGLILAGVTLMGAGYLFGIASLVDRVELPEGHWVSTLTYVAPEPSVEHLTSSHTTVPTSQSPVVMSIRKDSGPVWEWDSVNQVWTRSVHSKDGGLDLKITRDPAQSVTADAAMVTAPKFYGDATAKIWAELAKIDQGVFETVQERIQEFLDGNRLKAVYINPEVKAIDIIRFVRLGGLDRLFDRSLLQIKIVNGETLDFLPGIGSMLSSDEVREYFQTEVAPVLAARLRERVITEVVNEIRRMIGYLPRSSALAKKLEHNQSIYYGDANEPVLWFNKEISTILLSESLPEARALVKAYLSAMTPGDNDFAMAVDADKVKAIVLQFLGARPQYRTIEASTRESAVQTLTDEVGNWVHTRLDMEIVKEHGPEVIINKILRGFTVVPRGQNYYSIADRGSLVFAIEGNLQFLTNGEAYAVIKGQEDNAATTGGIDLNGKNMGMEVSAEGARTAVTFDPAMIAAFQQGNFSGVEGIILKVVPISSPLPLLGLETGAAGVQLAQR